MKPNDHLDYTTCFQRAAERLFAGLPDRPRVRMDKQGQIRFTYRTWSAAMTRNTFKGIIPLYRARKLIPGGARGGPVQVAMPIIRAMFGNCPELQARRNATAARLGLTINGRHADLDPSRVLIDRQQKTTLVAEGLDLHAAVIAMGKRHEWWFSRNIVETVQLDVDSHILTLGQSDDSVPILSAWQQIEGGAFYTGDTLDLDVPVPEIIALAAAGWQLGEIVETRSPELNQRRIRSMVTWPVEAALRRQQWTVTSILLEPDMVKIGPQRQ